METHHWHRSKFGMWLSIALVVIMLVVVVTVYHTDLAALGNTATIAPAHASGLLEGIGFAGVVTDADVAYLQDGLQFLHDYIPEWHGYIAAAKPLTLSVNIAAGERGIVANSKCCDERGYGWITFGDHFGDWGISDDSEDQTGQARQITFLSTLIHEVTHMRDQRAERLSPLPSVACAEGEKSAMTQEAEFMRALTVVKIGDDPNSSMLYQRAIERQVSIVEGDVRSAAWYFYCAIQHQEQE